MWSEGPIRPGPTKLMHLPRALLAAIALVGVTLVSLSAQATPVTYEFATGSLDKVRLLDLSNGSAPCPPSSPTGCLVDPVAIDFGSATVDTETGAILNLTITLSGSGELDLMGINGWASATFTLTTYQSDGAGMLFDLGDNEFALLPYGGDVTVDTLELFAVGNTETTPDFSGGYSMATSPLGRIQLSDDELALTLEGVDIGFFQDPVTGRRVLAKADFSMTALASGGATAVPEPTAAFLFCIGLSVAGYTLRRPRAV
jgi:hypothetical protein